jgi:hypothetical protein
MATTTTAANGTYAINGLPAGNHLVRFRTPVGSPLASEWHLNATGPATATVVPLTTGATTIDAQLALKP